MTTTSAGEVLELAKAEAFLVEQAELFDAAALAGIAKQLLDTLLPDGTLSDERLQQRRRFLNCVPHGEGMHRLTADLDTETPRPGADGPALAGSAEASRRRRPR